MTHPAKHYQRAIHRRFQRLANWQPDDELAIGDLGVLQGGSFRRVATLAELGIPCAIDEGETRAHRSFTSTSGVSLRADANAKVPSGLARVIARFESSGAFVFEAEGVRQDRLAGAQEVVSKLRALRETSIWDRRWVLVDQVWRVGLGTVIIATGGASEVGLTVRADAGPGLRALVDGGVAGELEAHGDEVYKLLGQENFTPLYTAWTFGIWGQVKHLGPGAREESNEPPPRLGIDELLDSWDADEGADAAP